MKNSVVNGKEIAPDCCIVCGKKRPDTTGVVTHWTYLAGSKPLGAITCSLECTDQAVKRWKETGRVDTPEMRIQ
jgi:hypothetical protein